MLGATKVCMARRILYQKTARIQDRYCNISYKKTIFHGTCISNTDMRRCRPYLENCQLAVREDANVSRQAVWLQSQFSKVKSCVVTMNSV